MSEYSIATHALPAATVAALRSMLKTLAPMLGTRWEVRDQLPADVLMAPAEMLARLPPVPRHSKLPLFVALAADDAQLAIAFASIKRPVSPPRLLEAIQAVEEQIRRIRSPQSLIETVPLLEKLDIQAKLAPGTLDMRLRTGLRAATFRLLQAPVAASLIDETRHAIYSVLPGIGFATRQTAVELVATLRANPPTILIELSSTDEKALAQARDFRPLRELEWSFWISARSPWLRPEVSQTGRYRLLRWPDFGRLPHSHAEVRLASFLMTQPMTLDELGTRTDVSRERAMNFLNAVHGLGLLAPAEAGSARRVEKPRAGPSISGLGALISQLRRKFGLTRSERVGSV